MLNRIYLSCFCLSSDLYPGQALNVRYCDAQILVMRQVADLNFLRVQLCIVCALWNSSLCITNRAMHLSIVLTT
jgi:hypothetical protein